jgi:virulence-associated protein VapD
MPENYGRACYDDGRLTLEKVGFENTVYIAAEKARQIQGAYS